MNSVARQSSFLVTVVLLGAALAGAVEPPASVLQAERERIEAMQRATRSAVAVFGPGGGGGGSAVVITPDGFALSNFHVVKPIGNYMQCGMADGVLYDAVVVGVDPTGDVALIKLLGREDFPYAEMGDSDHVRVGDWCFAVGNPFLLATDFRPTISYGIVSGIQRYQPPAGTLLEYADCIQTDAAINPGNSGGPLFDAHGRLIGINGRGSFEKRGRVNVGVGYAISINQIKKFLGYLHSGRIVDHATLGATVITDDQGRLLVSDILTTSDAFRRGLRYGDQILSFGGRPVSTVNGFKNVLGIFPRDWRVPLTYRRDGEIREVLVRLAGVHTREELLAKVQHATPLPPDNPPLPKERPADPEQPPEEQQKPPRRPAPRVMPGRPQPLPAHVADLIKERPGFANYHFNELNQSRVWNAFAAHGDFRARTAAWIVSGQLAGGGAFEITLDNEQVTGRFPSGRDRIDVRLDLDQQLLPPGSGGLLPALHLWRRLLVMGPREFGETFYLGTVPLPNRSELFDVLVGTHNVVETHFAFDPATGYLTALEMFPESNTDPCELSLSDYRPVSDLLLPHRIEVRWGDIAVAELLVEQYRLPDASESSDPKASTSSPSPDSGPPIP